MRIIYIVIGSNRYSNNYLLVARMTTIIKKSKLSETVVYKIEWTELISGCGIEKNCREREQAQEILMNVGFM